MRVTIASRIFAPEPAAAAFRLRAVVDELVARGHDVDVLTTRYGSARHEQANTMRVRRARVHRSHDGFVRGYLSYLSFDVPLFVRLLFTTRPDVVLVEPPPTTGLVALVVCWARRVPAVWYAADVWSDAAAIAGAPRAVTAVLERVESWVLRRTSAVLAVSPDVAQRVLQLSGREAISVGNGVDTSIFTMPDPIPAPSTPPVFVYAGTSSEFQGASVFVHALRILRESVPEARLLVVGGGSEVQAIAERAAIFPPGVVTVLERQSSDVAATLLAGATASLASIVPGVGYDFAVPTKIFASTACGTPVIFAGPNGAAAGVLASAPRSWAVSYSPESIADAMAEAIAVDESPHRVEERRAVSTWAHEVGSLASVARRVVDVLDGVASRRRT